MATRTVHTQTVQIRTADGQADAFLALPDRDGPHPGVLLHSDAFGLRPELETRARELAGHGYVVLVPNLYYRHGPAPVIELPDHVGEDVRLELIGRFMPLVQEHTPERILRDAEAYLGFLSDRPEVAPGPVAVIGYCIGAALAMRTATAFPERVAALAGFHPGFLVTDAPDSPHRQLSSLKATVHLGLSEAGDMSPASAGKLIDALGTSGVSYSTETYPGTIHGYTMSDTDAFSPSGLQLHWDRLLPLLGSTLTSG